jgi:hypothetical protein
VPEADSCELQFSSDDGILPNVNVPSGGRPATKGLNDVLRKSKACLISGTTGAS